MRVRLCCTHCFITQTRFSNWQKDTWPRGHLAAGEPTTSPIAARRHLAADNATKQRPRRQISNGTSRLNMNAPDGHMISHLPWHAIDHIHIFFQAIRQLFFFFFFFLNNNNKRKSIFTIYSAICRWAVSIMNNWFMIHSLALRRRMHAATI